MRRRPVGVVVPVHDEQVLLPRCLTALRCAVAAVPNPVQVVLVLDACTDASAELAAAADLGTRTTVLAVAHRSVGAARAAGCRSLLTDLGADGWLFTTDADSAVPEAWLRRGLRYADSGWDAVAGTVVVDDWRSWSGLVRAAYDTGYRTGRDHRHVHGANLGVSAAAYRAVGGFGPLDCHEDAGLVDALIAAGHRVAWGTDLAVLTSGRSHGRAPGGFSGHLRSVQRAVSRSLTGVGGGGD